MTDGTKRTASPPRVRVDPPASVCSGAPLSGASGESPRAARPRLPFLSSSPPVRSDSGPQEAPPARDSAGEPLLSQPPGGRPFLNAEEVRSTIADAVKTIVWAIIQHDHRMCADWLEDIASQVHAAGEDDHRAAIRKEREMLRGSEDRKSTCPAWWFQRADYGLKPRWDECKLGSFTACPSFKDKGACWARWDRENPS